MPIFGEKPFTSITVKVNQLCTANRNSDLEDESIELYVEDLISLIKLQSSGAVECARAVRKKIKYGNTPQESVLALNLLELLVLNAGSKIGQTIASDDKLTDLLKTIVAGQGRSGLGGPYDGLVVRRIRELAYGWKTEFDGLNGYSNFANLYKSAPQSRHRKQSSRQVTPPEDDQENEDEFRDPVRSSSRSQGPSSARSPPPRPSAMSPYADPPRVDRSSKSKSKSKKSKKSGKVYADEQYKIPQINYKVEAPKIRTTISDCHTHTTALDNSLLALPKGKNPMDDPKASSEFEKCRKIRHKVLRYLQFVGAGDNDHKTIEIIALDEEFLGSLIVANEQLVTSFKRFDELCGYTTENPAEYHQEDRNNDPISSDESYYSSDSEEEEEELSGRMNDLHVRQASSRLESVTGSDSAYESSSAAAHREVPAPRKAAPRPPQVKRQESIISTESGDPFGDGNAVSREKSLYY